MWHRLSPLTVATVMLIASMTIQATTWMDYSEPLSDVDTTFDDDSDQFMSALTRDEEQEIHSPFMTGLKYVSGGAGEGRQHLSPSGDIPNHLEIKTDEELPAYCSPPNPCPYGYEAEDCDQAPMSKFTAEYSRLYQEGQNCQCDADHDDCSLNSIMYTVPPHGASNGVLKRARRIRRNVLRRKEENSTKKVASLPNPYHRGRTLRLHVAKKSPGLSS